MMYALLTMPLAMPLEKVADQTISAKADGCSMSTVAFSSMDYMTGPNQMTMVNLFNAAAATRTVEFIGASGCGNTAKDYTYHHSTCKYTYGTPSIKNDGGTYTMDFRGWVQASRRGCTSALSCLGSMLSSTPFVVACSSPRVAYTFKAVGGGDWYEAVVGLYSFDSSGVETLVDAHVYRGQKISSYVTKEFTSFPSGTYFLRFFGASYDYSGGTVLGAKLYVKSATGTFSPLPEFDSPPPPAPPTAPPSESVSVHGDPMFQHDGKGQHFWLKEDVLNNLLDWKSDDGHKMSLQGLTVANAETGHQWFKQIALMSDGKKVLSSQVVFDDKPTLALSSLNTSTVTIDSFVKGNGVDAKDVTGVSAGGMTFELTAESAHKFDDTAQQSKYAHVNVKMPNGLAKDATGLFAELAGAQPMSDATKALLASPK